MSEHPRTGEVRTRIRKAKINSVFNSLIGVLKKNATSAAVGQLAASATGFDFGANAVAKLTDINEALRAEDNTKEALAYEWIAGALALTVLQLGGRLAKSQAEHMQESVTLLTDDITIDSSFFYEPRAFPLVDIVRNELANQLNGRGGSKAEWYERLSPLPAVFVYYLHGLYADNQERYAKVIGATEGPFVEAEQRAADWDRYSANVISHEWTFPIFEKQGEYAFPLAQVYVPLSATVTVPASDADDEGEEIFVEEERPDQRKKYKTNTIESIDGDLDAWLERPDDPDGRVRLITGGPGSGKSSLMKALAMRTDTRRAGKEHWHVVFVPLHRGRDFHFSGKGLEEDIRTYLRTKSFAQSHDPFSDRTPVPLLLLFDGLDELVMPDGQQAVSQARDLVRDVVTLVNALSGRRRVRAVISGRNSVMQEVSKEGRSGNTVGRVHLFQVQPYNETQIKTANRKYSEALGVAPEELPGIVTDARFSHLIREPLLHAFSVMSHERLAKVDLAKANRAHVYDAMFGNMFDRETEKLPGGGYKPAHAVFCTEDAEDPEDDFFRAMEAIALASYRSDDRDARYRTAARGPIEEALKECGHAGLLERLGESGIAGLAATFFTRYEDEAGGVEFHHKSFGEYLYARRLSRWVFDHANAKTGIPAAEIVGYGDDARKKAFVAWLTLADANRMTLDVLDLLKDELVRRCGSRETGDQWHVTLWPVLERALQEGWRIGSEKVSHREAERRNVAAEEALFCTWRWLWLDRETTDTEPPSRWRLPLLERDNRAIARIRARQFQFFFDQFAPQEDAASPFACSLSLADLSGAWLADLDWYETTFCGADLKRANLTRADLTGANLTGANLTRADLTGANLRDADLRDAYLRGADLTGANLTGANLTRANLRDADLRDADLRGADLTGADLTGANLRGADLTGADLTGANLTGADLTGADLTRARFSQHPKESGARWDEADPPRNLDAIIIGGI
jgi:hypothetical protein